MEGVPNNDEIINVSVPEKEVTFEEEASLARALFDAVNECNEFIEHHGGVDTFYEVGQHIGDERTQFDALENSRNVARKAFDEKVLDKAGFIQKMRVSGETAIADRISEMFRGPKNIETPKGSIFSKLFKKLK